MQNYNNHNEVYLYVNIYEIELRKKIQKCLKAVSEIKKQEKTKSLLYLLKSKKLIHDNIRYDIKSYLQKLKFI